MRCVGRLMVSWPSTLTEPSRRPVRPSTARIVVVRPAPLRPSKVTTSPGCTTMSTPCSTCDSPYQACRPLISNPAVISVSTLELTVGGAHVGFHHLRVARDFGIRAFGQHGPALQHGDGVGN